MDRIGSYHGRKIISMQILQNVLRKKTKQNESAILPVFVVTTPLKPMLQSCVFIPSSK